VNQDEYIKLRTVLHCWTTRAWKSVAYFMFSLSSWT